jgi:hypothetical protein
MIAEDRGNDSRWSGVSLYAPAAFWAGLRGTRRRGRPLGIEAASDVA